MLFQPVDRLIYAVGAQIVKVKAAAFQVGAHRLLRFRQPAATAFQFEENHLPIGSGELQIGPAGDDTKPLQPGCGDRIAIFAERDITEPPPRIARRSRWASRECRSRSARCPGEWSRCWTDQTAVRWFRRKRSRRHRSQSRFSPSSPVR